MRLGEISHYCFIGYLCTQNSSSIAASPLGALYHHPSHILILWRHDISFCKDSVGLAGTVDLAILFSSGFFQIKHYSSPGWPSQPSHSLYVLLVTSFPLSSWSNHILAQTWCHPLLSDAHMKPSLLPDPDSHSCWQNKPFPNIETPWDPCIAQGGEPPGSGPQARAWDTWEGHMQTW